MPANPLRKLTRTLLSEPRAILELLEAQTALLLARLARHRTPLGRLVEESSSQSPADPRWEIPARRVSLAVDRAARLGLIRPTCLEQAMAMQRMLKRRGVEPGVIRIGVLLRDGRFAAHAWIQIGNRVLGDSSQRVSRFHRLTDVKAVDR